MSIVNIQEKDEYPLYCLSFSPNWNTYQIISTNDQGRLAYGSNAECFLIDFKNKNFLSSFKSKEEISSNYLKVTAVLLTENLLFVGYSNGAVYAFNHKNQNQFLFKAKASQHQIMHVIQRPNKAESLRLILIDSEGMAFELIYIHEITKVFPLMINCSSQVVKCGEYFVSHHNKTLLLIITQKGIVELWDLEQKQNIFSYNTNSSICKADFILENENTLICGIVTKKNFLLVLKLKLDNILSPIQGSQAIQTFPIKLNFQLQSKSKSDPEVLAAKPDILFIGTKKVF